MPKFLVWLTWLVMLAIHLGLPRQSEVLLIVFLGICFLSLDFSLFHLKSNVEAIWKLELNKAKYLEFFLKYVISAIVVVRTFTLHLFLAFYVIMLWPAIFVSPSQWTERPHTFALFRRKNPIWCFLGSCWEWSDAWSWIPSLLCLELSSATRKRASAQCAWTMFLLK